MTREDRAIAILREYLVACPAFRFRRIGAPDSDAREKQEAHMRLEDRALALLRELSGEWHCPRCEGSGWHHRLGLPSVDCALCKGTGKMTDAVACDLNT